MTARTHDRADASDDKECIVLELENGEVILYDPTNHHAWMQSTAAVDVSSHA